MAKNAAHERGLTGTQPYTLSDGRTLQYPELIYWTTVNDRDRSGFSDSHKYVVEYLRSADDYKTVGPMVTRDGWSTFVQDVGRMSHTYGVAVDVTSDNMTATIHKVEQIADRDYVLTFSTETFSLRGNRQVNYLMRDCNHFIHATNRFKKRVRAIAEQLGIHINVSDDNTEYIEMASSRTATPALSNGLKTWTGEPTVYPVYAIWKGQTIGEKIGENVDAFEAIRQAQSVYRSLSNVFTDVQVWVNDPTKNSLSGGSYRISASGESVV